MTKSNPKKSNLDKAARARGARGNNDLRSEWHEFALSLVAIQSLAEPPLKKDLYNWVAFCVNESGTVSGKPVTPGAVEKAVRDKKWLLDELTAEARKKEQNAVPDDPAELAAIGERLMRLDDAGKMDRAAINLAKRRAAARALVRMKATIGEFELECLRLDPTRRASIDRKVLEILKRLKLSRQR